MTFANPRALLHRPFRQYATFSGRSGRAEFWLFILAFFVLTNVAWPVGYGVMKIAGFESHHHIGSSHPHETTHRNLLHDETISKHLHNGPDNPIIFKLHRHMGEHMDDHMGEHGYHLHGSIAPWWDDDDHRRGRHERQERHFTFHFDNHVSTYAEDGGNSLQGIVVLALLIPLFAVGARRLHDTDKSGWWQLFALIPLAGWLVLVIFFLIEGDKEENRFGAPAE